MNSDEASRGMHYSANRKSNVPKNHNYSPSANYNYNGNQSAHGSHGNHSGGHGSHGNHGNSGYGNQPQHQRRKSSHFKRDGHNVNDRLVKQNDIIIRILKEIRDRLPPPPAEEKENPKEENEQSELMAAGETSAENADARETVPESTETGEGKTHDENDEELDQEVNGNV